MFQKLQNFSHRYKEIFKITNCKNINPISLHSIFFLIGMSDMIRISFPLYLSSDPANFLLPVWLSTGAVKLRCECKVIFKLQKLLVLIFLNSVL